MPTNKDFLERKLQLAYKHLEALEATEVTPDSLSFIDSYSKIYYLYQNLVERCLGLATYILKTENLSIPDTARDTFEKLAQADIISPESARQLRGAYGFRNAIIHDYDSFHSQELVENHPHNLVNLRNYLKQIATHISRP